MTQRKTPPASSADRDTEALIASALRTFEAEAGGITALAVAMRDGLGAPFVAAVERIRAARGRVIVSGMGKSGHVGRKIAATFSSTGTPAFFVHPAEASHGDLGMITHDDVVIAISYSGESDELITVLPLVKRMGARLVALTGQPGSTLATLADVVLDAHVEKEACPLNLAPTASTTAALALGDALAVALLDARGFGHEDFARSHPGGRLGRRLLTHVRDVMRTGPDVPSVSERATLAEAVLEVSRKRMGMTAVVDDAGRLVGIFTDGDLRRSLERGGDIRATPIALVMTRAPRTIRPEALAAEAVELMEARKSTQLPVVDAAGVLVGALNIHDLFRAKVL